MIRTKTGTGAALIVSISENSVLYRCSL